jgi:hypothetical protein
VGIDDIEKFVTFRKSATFVQMRPILFFICLLFFSLNANSQSYLGWVTGQVNFRSGPSKNYEVIKTLKPGSQIFINSLEEDSGFYSVIDIETNLEGYVHKSFVKLGKLVPFNNEGVFTPDERITDFNSKAEIFNNTEKELTVKLNNEVYSFAPSEKRTITLSPGNYVYRASAPGVIPAIGNEKFDNNMSYKWQFYIVTRRY